MPDRVPSDHDAVDTHRVPVESVGRTDRPRVVLPDSLGLEAGDAVRFALDGERYHAVVGSTLDGDTVVSHIADNRRLAREGEGTNRLAEWIAESDVSLGGTAHLDVVTDGTEYGVRSPGTRVVYTTTEEPDSSLADIARDLDG